MRRSCRSSRSSPRFPALHEPDYLIRVGLDTLIFMLLALGLNVVVGCAGLLDLGYVAFFGFGAYVYAMLSSEHFGIHWPAAVVDPDRRRRDRAARPPRSGCRRAAWSATTSRS